MTKEKVFEMLKGMECEIAEVKCGIVANSGNYHSNVSILVYLVEEPSNDDLIDYSKHWQVCTSIEDFKKSIKYGNLYGNPVNFDEPVPFVTDFESGVKRIHVRTLNEIRGLKARIEMVENRAADNEVACSVISALDDALKPINHAIEIMESIINKGIDPDC